MATTTLPGGLHGRRDQLGGAGRLVWFDRTGTEELDAVRRFEPGCRRGLRAEPGVR